MMMNKSLKMTERIRVVTNLLVSGNVSFSFFYIV